MDAESIKKNSCQLVADNIIAAILAVTTPAQMQYSSPVTGPAKSERLHESTLQAKVVF